MGNTIDQLSSMTSSTAEQEFLQFEEPIHEYVRILNAVKAAIARRQAKKNIYLQAIIDCEAKQNWYS